MKHDVDSTDPVAIARSLLTCPSITPHEGGALDYLGTLLSDAGFEVHRVPFSDDNTPDIDNLYARIGSGSPHICFAGHTDVVPVGDEADWTHPPFGGVIADDILHGRGAVDMKGGIAAYAAAALNHLREHGLEKGSLSFLITGDEEGPAINGTIKLLQWVHDRGERFDMCLVGEPTNPETIGDAIKIGRRGSQNGAIRILGKQGHVAYPDRAINPMRGLAKALTSLFDEPLDQGTDHFQPSNLEIVSIDTGNTTFNVIPSEVRATFNVRYNDLWTPEAIEDWISAKLSSALPDGTGFDIRMEPALSRVFLTRDETLIGNLSAAIEDVTGHKPALSTGGGTSDARFIRNYCPVVEFGLVGQTMHQTDECVPVADLQKLTLIYAAFIRRSLNTDL
ncbi:succinyl-diaminopimelate desuccinylase [Coralliovum pocilloporae]|uniref:succinyl-diaminopimelate desuccinylase n=1 Tax=Coralliovum pocilloporae TaxID=3066369 RepID=UPI0033073F89